VIRGRGLSVSEETKETPVAPPYGGGGESQTKGVIWCGWRRCNRNRRGRGAATISFALTALCAGSLPGYAQNATWVLNPSVAGPAPTTFDFNANANWTPAAVPTGTATFGVSNSPRVSFSTATTVGGWTFNAGASNYMFNVSRSDLQFTGAGIVINGGSASIINNRSLSFNNGSTAGSTAITNNASLNFRNTSTAGTAAVTNNGSLTFEHASTAGSASITNASFSSFLDSSTAGNAIITNNLFFFFENNSTAGNAKITNNLHFQFYDASTAGSATITNNEFLTFQHTSSAGGASITNNFFLAFLGASTAGNSAITNNSTMWLLDVATGGNATIINKGSLSFFDNSTGGNGAITNVGSTVTTDFSGSTGWFNDKKLSAGSIAGSGSFYLGANQLTVGGNNLSTTVAGVISDCGLTGNDCAMQGSTGGSLIKTGTGTLILSGANTYTGGTTISGGTLQLGNGGTSGSIVGNVLDNGIFAINRSDAFTFGPVISGSGALQQLGTGITTLTALESYTGLTTIASGTLALSGTGNIASSIGVLANGTFDISKVSGAGTSIQSLSGPGSVALGVKTLTLTNASGNFAGAIGGTGGFTLAAGNETLSGSNIYSGTTTVNAGTLSVNGSIASSSLTTVNAGGTLGGNGTVGNTTINGGTLAPGNSIGLLTVQGSLAFTAASSYMVEVSPANADRTNVTGTATPGGATVKASFGPGTYVARQYTILNAAGGVSGTFSSLVNTDLPANFKSSLSYDANDVYLNLALSFIPPPGSGLNANQQNVANAIVGFFNSTGTIPLVFGGLTPAGLTQISGEVATGSQQTTFNAMNQFMGVLTDPFIAGRGDPVASSAGAPQFADEDDAALAYASDGKARSKSERDAYAAVYRKAPVMADTFTQRWSVWAAGYGGSQTTDGNAALGSNNTRSSIGGVAVGADYRFSPYTLAGFAVAGGATNFSVNGLGSGRSDLFQAGAFVRHNVGAAYLTGALAHGWQDITTDRTVTIAGTDLLRANFNANAFSGRVEGGYRFVTPWMAMGITPYAAGQFTTFDLPAYAEQAVAGANTFALAYGAKSVTASRSELGLRTDKSFAMQNGIFTLRGRAAWAHDFNTDRNIAATFQTLPGASFVVNGAAQAHDAALVTASAEMKWLNGFALAATFEGEFSNVTTSYAGKGVARYSW
jgi:autotransporter-associated beta strand protein